MDTNNFSTAPPTLRLSRIALQIPSVQGIGVTIDVVGLDLNDVLEQFQQANVIEQRELKGLISEVVSLYQRQASRQQLSAQR